LARPPGGSEPHPVTNWMNAWGEWREEEKEGKKREKGGRGGRREGEKENKR